MVRGLGRDGAASQRSTGPICPVEWDIERSWESKISVMKSYPDIVPAEPITQEVPYIESTPAPFENPDWRPLPPHLEKLLYIVPEVSYELERTTVLTWIHRNEGVLRFDDMVSRVTDRRFYAVARRYARRSVLGLCKIGAARLVNISVKGGRTVYENIEEFERQTHTKMNSSTYIVMTRHGLSWMQRAFSARHLALGGLDYRLPWAHRTMLDEEEEEGEGHWIEKLTGFDRPRAARSPLGQCTSWISKPVGSVFDLANLVASQPAKGRTQRLLRA